MLTVAEELKALGVKSAIDALTLWKGPEVDGITFSLLSRYLTCKERFRIQVMEGWTSKQRFNNRLEYGNFWHLCEEIIAQGKTLLDAQKALNKYCNDLCKVYPQDQEDIEKWYNVCKAQYPIYLNYWFEREAKEDFIPLLSEQKFRVSYNLPSGRKVTLRGKWDSVKQFKHKSEHPGIWLQENKTKGDIEEDKIKKQLTFDLQTMIYMITLNQEKNNLSFPTGVPLNGILYNVVRRPLSGGKHTIRQHQPSKSNPEGESKTAYFERLKGLIAGEPEYFFMRWNVKISQEDIEVFKVVCLNPILENLVDDWEWWKYCMENDIVDYDYLERNKVFPKHTQRHYRHPYGIFNIIDNGGTHELDYYLMTSETSGLVKCANLFPELS